MKKLRFLEIWLLSETEKKARKFEFSEDANAIIGDNKVGKSTLIKSLYYTLGADVQFETEWIDAHVASILKFQLNNDLYYMYRKRSSFAIFDSNKNLLHTFSKITSELGPYLAKLFDFQLKLKDKNRGTVTPTPAFQYLPFFVNQDRSWENAWSGFENLNQFSNIKKSLAEYHTGLKPNKYYVLSQKIDNLNRQIKDLESDKSAAVNAKTRYEKQHPESTFNIDIDAFKNEIDELIAEAQKLNKEQERYREKLVNLRNQEFHYDSQIKVLQASIRELEKDHKHVVKLAHDHDHDEVSCPTCGTEFENSFLSRFAIIDDIETCKSMVIEFQTDKNELKKKTEKVTQKLEKYEEQHSKIQELLSRKKEAVALDDIIHSEGRKGTLRAFSETISSYTDEIKELLKDKHEAEKERNKTTSAERKEKIQSTFSKSIKEFMSKLDLPEKTIDEDRLEGKINASGSEKPRALLAYYYGVLNTIREYSTFCFFPIVIDSPNQQDQDEDNRERIFDFVVSEQPGESQIILGSVELHNADFQGKIIKLDQKRSLLTEKGYEEISLVFFKFTDQIYASL